MAGKEFLLLSVLAGGPGESGIPEQCCLAQAEPPGHVTPAKCVVLSVEIVFGCFGCMDTGAFLILPSI